MPELRWFQCKESHGTGSGATCMTLLYPYRRAHMLLVDGRHKTTQKKVLIISVAIPYIPIKCPLYPLKGVQQGIHISGCPLTVLFSVQHTLLKPTNDNGLTADPVKARSSHASNPLSSRKVLQIATYSPPSATKALQIPPSLIQ